MHADDPADERPRGDREQEVTDEDPRGVLRTRRDTADEQGRSDDGSTTFAA